MSTATLHHTRIHEVVHSLGQISSRWLDPTWALRREGVAALQVSTTFQARLIEQALDAAFTELTEDKIIHYLTQEPAFARDPLVSFKVLHILAGNVFTAWLPGAITTLLLGADCLLKTSASEQVFAPLWKRSVNLVDPTLGKKIHVVPWKDDLLESCDAVVAYGSDDTLEDLRDKTPGNVRFIGYGHKISVAVIFKEAFKEHSIAELLALSRKDIEPFQLQGCLSPQTIYIEGEDSKIFNALRERVPVMPQFKRFKHWDELMIELKPLNRYLSVLGFLGSEARIQPHQTQIDQLGFSRVCRLGEMQQPPLTWRNSGFSLADVLTR
jgi:hypothetical protein